MDAELTLYQLGLDLMKSGKTVDEACDEIERVLFDVREQLRYKDEE